VKHEDIVGLQSERYAMTHLQTCDKDETLSNKLLKENTVDYTMRLIVVARKYDPIDNRPLAIVLFSYLDSLSVMFNSFSSEKV
jgi:hypothetical protein